MNYGGDGSGERAPLLSPKGAGNLGPPIFRACASEAWDSTLSLLTLELGLEPPPLAPKDPKSETPFSLVYTRGNGVAFHHICWLPDSSDSDVEEVSMEDIPVIPPPPKTHMANRRRGWLASPGPGNFRDRGVKCGPWFT